MATRENNIIHSLIMFVGNMRKFCFIFFGQLTLMPSKPYMGNRRNINFVHSIVLEYHPLSYNIKRYQFVFRVRAWFQGSADDKYSSESIYQPIRINGLTGKYIYPTTSG